MSLSPSIGIVGPSHWTYAAAVMADRLDRVIREQRVTEGLIPEGVYRGIKRFFALILNSDGKQIPAANIANCLIAANALARSRETPPRNLLEFDEILNAYSNFVNSLADERPVTLDEIKEAEELKRFFKQLEQDGETEAYEKLVRRDASSLSR